MADEYTPATDQVREAASLNGGIAVEPDAFDRWLAAHDRETAACAWDEGYMATGGRGHHEREATNPYREEDRRG